MSNIGIYTILSPSGKIYVGQSWDLIKRRSYYKNIKRKTQPKIYSSIKKYGWAAHKFKVMIHLAENVRNAHQRL